MGSITPSIYGLVSTLKLQSWNNSQKLQARENIGAASTISNTFSGLVNFSGTDTPGLQLKSLTDAQITALVTASALPDGSILISSTTNRARIRLNSVTEEVLTTAGGQTIGGALTVSGLLDLRKAATANILQFSTTAFLRTDTSQLSIFDTGLARSNISLWRSGNFVVGSTTLIAASSGADATGNVVDTSLSRNAAGVWQMGTTTNNALGSLNLTNLTASGTVTISDANGSLQIFNSAMVLRRGGGSSLLLENGNAGHPLDLSASGPVNIVSAQGIPACLGFSNTRANLTPSVRISQESAGVLQIGTTANNALGSLLLNNLTASGTVTAAGTGTHTFGTTNTVTMTAGAISASQGTGVPTLNIANPGNSSPDACARIGTASAGLWVAGANYGVRATAGNATTVPFTARGFAGQTANLQEWQNSAATVLASVSSAGNLTASGTLRVGGGTVVANILSATATLDFPSIATNDTHTLTITVTGAVAGDSVFLGVPAGLEAGLIFCASVTAADTVTVRMHNSSGGSIDPASGTFRATVIRF